VPPFVLTVLKVVFLALLYFFVYRAIRSVVVDLRGGPHRREQRGQSAPPKAAREGRKGKAPSALVVLSGNGKKVDTIPLSGQVQIGRADACQVQLSDTYVSTFHARIFNRDGAWFVEDLGSTNGTYVNQRRVTSPVELRVGDQVKLGKTTLELKK
jgi:pSer/pThr/pTyr-binding forkhead associated (FHA) protein